MESPNKRLKQSPSSLEADVDYVPLGGDEDFDKAAQYGYSEANGSADQNGEGIHGAPRAPRAMYQRSNHHGQARNAWNDPRNAKDRPKSRHVLPGYEPWVLVKTKFARRFVHNTETKESFWYIPQDVMPAVHAFERWEVQQKEKDANAKWAEEQLEEMRGKSQAEEVNKAADAEGRTSRRRSESLQREDEEAMMAELAAEAERAEERDAKEVVQQVEPLEPVSQLHDGGGYDSETSYEEVEVTDSEYEDDGDEHAQPTRSNAQQSEDHRDDGPVVFGEDDIAWQLAAMNDDEEDYAPDPADYDEEEYDEDEQHDAAATIFRELLNDHHISPFTPWDTLISSSSSILTDERYTLLSSTRARKEVWEAWVKDTAAQLKEERAQMEKQDPRIPFLAFLAEKATPKLYWPEFKRKFKKDEVMNSRGLSDKEREKLYRDHVNKLKLPESTRKADLINVLKSIPLRDLHRGTSLDALPQQVLSDLAYISLLTSARDEVIRKHISALPPAPSGEDGPTEDGKVDAEEDKKRERQANALAERERKVEEDRRKAEKEERWAKRNLREGEEELRRAMKVGRGEKDAR